MSSADRPPLEPLPDDPSAIEPAPLSNALTQPALPSAAPYVKNTRVWALIAVLALAFLGAAIVAAPLWAALLLGIVMALSVQRPFRWLDRRLGPRHRHLAAAIVTLATGALLVVIGAIVLVTLTNELMKVVTHLDQNGQSTIDSLLGPRAERAIADLGIDPQKFYARAQAELGRAANYAAALAGIVLRTTTSAVLAAIVGLMTLYYMLLEGPSIARRIEKIAPLEPRHTRELLSEAREVGRTAFLGTLATAIVQGSLAGLGYAVMGVPQPVTWAVATALFSFLPVAGTLLVWVPLAGWLLVDGHPVRAILLAAWGVLIVTSLVDYFVRPRIIGRNGHGHPLLTLIALLGGIEVFGLAGLIVAPILMSIFVAAFRLYEREVAGADTKSKLPPSTLAEAVPPKAVATSKPATV